MPPVAGMGCAAGGWHVFSFLVAAVIVGVVGVPGNGGNGACAHPSIRGVRLPSAPNGGSWHELRRAKNASPRAQYGKLRVIASTGAAGCGGWQPAGIARALAAAAEIWARGAG